MLRERGVDPVPLLAVCHLAPAYFEEPDNPIPFATMGRILGLCAERSLCPHFGLLVGERCGISALGAVGYLAQSAPDVRSALAALTSRYRSHNPGASLSLGVEGSSVSLRYRILSLDVESREQILDGAMAIAFNIMRVLCERNWVPSEVRFAHARPSDFEPFRRFFQADLTFDAEETELIFPAHWLDRVLPSADPRLNRMMLQRLGANDAIAAESMAEALRRMLPGAQTAHDASRTVMAGRVGMGVRTLNRRLAAEGTSFVKLRDETRYAVARQLLENTRIPVTQIGYHLGYANPSGFTRAFLRWSGVDPSTWRENSGNGTSGTESAPETESVRT